MSAIKSWMFRDERFERIWSQAKSYTMTSPERGYALYSAVCYIVQHKVHGALVECGVWRGGSAMIMLLTLKELGVSGRQVFLFDTFEGMTPAGELDKDIHGHAASYLMSDVNENERERNLVRAAACENEVRGNIAKCGYPPSLIRIIKGDVRSILPKIQTGPIALLRLDTDFYDSTQAEMSELYPRVRRSGVVIIDDYGHWQGSKLAVDQYFSSRSIPAPLLHAIDYTGRMFVKQDEAERIDIERYDYQSPGLDDPRLCRYFDSLVESDPRAVNWPYLRSRVPHIWRRDSRNPTKSPIGVLSHDEAVLVYNLAKQFSGCRALEIGCHFGWGSAHILAAGVKLDIVDPALGDTKRVEAMHSNLELIPTTGEYFLWAGFSPTIIPAVAATQDDPWSFVMIDGNHDGDAPALDARVVADYCADDAMVLFHDLTSPDVANGLAVLKSQGWNTRIFNTMQVIGVAWRGDVQLVNYTPDPNTPELKTLPHLAKYA